MFIVAWSGQAAAAVAGRGLSEGLGLVLLDESMVREHDACQERHVGRQDQQDSGDVEGNC